MRRGPKSPRLPPGDPDRALQLDKLLADAYWQRGIVELRTSVVNDAIKDLKRALELKPSRFEAQMALFYTALETNGPLPVTTADSRRALEIVTAFYHSSRTHQEVVFPIRPAHPLYKSWLPEGFA